EVDQRIALETHRAQFFQENLNIGRSEKSQQIADAKRQFVLFISGLLPEGSKQATCERRHTRRGQKCVQSLRECPIPLFSKTAYPQTTVNQHLSQKISKSIVRQ